MNHIDKRSTIDRVKDYMVSSPIVVSFIGFDCSGLFFCDNNVYITSTCFCFGIL